jgi:hypothetical protein
VQLATSSPRFASDVGLTLPTCISFFIMTVIYVDAWRGGL